MRPRIAARWTLAITTISVFVIIAALFVAGVSSVGDMGVDW